MTPKEVHDLDDAGLAWTALAALVALSILAEVGIYAMPLIVSGVSETHGLDEGSVGLMIALQIATTSLSAITLAPRVHLIDRRHFAFYAVALLLLGNLLAAGSSTGQSFALSRILCGLGEGIGLAVAAAVAGETRNPARTFTMIWIAIVVMACGLYIGVPPLSAAYGARTIFYALACSTAVAAVFLFRLPARSKALPAGAKTSSVQDSLWSARRVAMLVAVALLAICANGFFFFLVGIGERTGLNQVEMGRVMFVSACIALAGPIGARFAEGRVKWLMSAGAAVLVCGISSLTVTLTTSSILFAIAAVVSSTCYVFALPLLMGQASQMASGGRLAAASRGAQSVGSTLAPLIAGLILLQAAGYETIGYVSLLCASLSFLLLVYVNKSGDQQDLRQAY